METQTHSSTLFITPRFSLGTFGKCAAALSVVVVFFFQYHPALSGSFCESWRSFFFSFFWHNIENSRETTAQHRYTEKDCGHLTAINLSIEIKDDSQTVFRWALRHT